MGQKYFATLSGLALMVAAATPAFAASDAAQSHSRAQQTVAIGKRSMPNRLGGEIVSIDPVKKVVAVKHENHNGKDVTVVAVVDDHTRIREGKTDKSFADLKVGEHVQINYERQDKRDLAHEVLVENNSH
jgi:Cu/Ag efflux protein CusF